MTVGSANTGPQSIVPKPVADAKVYALLSSCALPVYQVRHLSWTRMAGTTKQKFRTVVLFVNQTQNKTGRVIL
eukprot:3883409-Amphidinium_carterae.1